MNDKSDASANFKAGFPFKDIPDGGSVAGRIDDDDAILVRQGDTCFAVGAHCTHYHGPLAEGLVVGDTVRCPWHHSCFNLRTGEPVRAPALDPIACWRVERVGDLVYAREKLPEPKPGPPAGVKKAAATPRSIVILGGGAAGLTAADRLRRDGYDGSLVMLSADQDPPVDRPNLSKDFLAGTAKDDWMPLRSPEFYTDQKIDLALNSRVSALDVSKKQVQLENGKTHSFDTLLIATGAEPVRLQIAGVSESQVQYLRSFADSRAIVARAANAKTVAVVGGSFIALEVAASLRARNVAVHVVAPDHQPLERVMGLEVGKFIRKVHEDHGVVFHLGQTVERFENGKATLKDGTTIAADFLVLGVGVRPVIGFAEKAGLAIDRGIVVNEYLETSAPGIFAAGDVARWPDPHTGDRIRVEHFVVAERLGQTAARNMLGYRERFDAVPFFWSQHYDVTINYVGHAEKWDRVDVDGAFDRDCAVRYRLGDRTLAVATIGRDMESLKSELSLESSSSRAQRSSG